VPSYMVTKTDRVVGGGRTVRFSTIFEIAKRKMLQEQSGPILVL
jgi:hypothetical protein